MKNYFALLLVAVVAKSSVDAAECTMDELTSISDIYSAGMETGAAACPDMTAATATTATDYCVSDCLGFMSDMLYELPDCSTGGVNVKEGLKAAIEYCDSGTADTSDILTDSSSSSALASDSSSLFMSDSSGDSQLASEASSSSGTSMLRTSSPSSSTTDSTTSDKVTSSTLAPAAGSSSSPASTTKLAVSSAAFAATAFILAAAL